MRKNITSRNIELYGKNIHISSSKLWLNVKGGQPRKSFVFLNTTTQTITSYRNKNWHVAKRTFPLPARYGGMLKRVKAVRLCWHSAKSRQDIANYQL